MSNQHDEKKKVTTQDTTTIDDSNVADVDPSKFTFVKRDEELHDEALQTKPIGYYKDAWIRFKKNRASVVAAVLISILLIFTVIGPYMKVYRVPDRSMTEAHRLRELPPRIPGLEKLGVFDGSRVIRRSQSHIDKIPEHIVKEIVDASGTQVYVDVYYYEYLNYYNSLPENSQTLTLSQYERALANNAVIELLEVTADGLYVTQVDYFRYSMQQRAEDTYFWFGTDMSGRDLFTLLWQGARISIFLAVSVTVINLVVGLILGAIAGYYGGTFDILFDRVVDILGNIPFLGILTLLVIRFGSSIFIVMIAFTVTGWLGSYRSTRAQYYRFKHREYVLAARSLGAQDGRVMFKHIFPNAIGTLITAFALSIPLFIFTESTFSFLGIINYAETTSIGRLLALGQQHMQQHYHLLLFPAIFLSILMLSFNLFGNGLRDAFNPSLRGVDE